MVRVSNKVILVSQNYKKIIKDKLAGKLHYEVTFNWVIVIRNKFERKLTNSCKIFKKATSDHLKAKYSRFVLL